MFPQQVIRDFVDLLRGTAAIINLRAALTMHEQAEEALEHAVRSTTS